jgi:hypothetical protein
MNKKVRFVCRVALLLVGFLCSGVFISAMKQNTNIYLPLSRVQSNQQEKPKTASQLRDELSNEIKIAATKELFKRLKAGEKISGDTIYAVFNGLGITNLPTQLLCSLVTIVLNLPGVLSLNEMPLEELEKVEQEALKRFVGPQKLPQRGRHHLKKKEKDALTLDLAIYIYEKKKKIENDDIRTVGKKYGFLKIKSVPKFLRRFGFLSVPTINKLSPKQLQKRLQELLRKRGFTEERLWDTTGRTQAPQTLGLVGQEVENKRIREKYEENNDIKQAPNGTSGKKRKPISPRQENYPLEGIGINSLNGNDDQTDQEKLIEIPPLMSEDIWSSYFKNN